MDYQRTFNLRYAASIFAYEIEDQIVYVPSGSGAPQAENVGQQKGKGLELELNWSASDALDITANYAYQQPTDKTNHDDTPDSPQQQLFIGTNWHFLPNWHLNAQANRVMQRSRAYNDTRSKVNDYTLVDLAIRRTDIARHWDLTLKVLNAFDADAYEPSPAEVALFVPNDYPLAGRAYYASVNYRF
jgi:iron complex outermembrane receptor protein